MPPRDADVTITTTDAVSLTVADTLHDYQRAHPASSVQLRVTNGFVDLVRREAEIAVHPMRAPWATLVGRRVANLAHAIYAARSYVGLASFDPWRADWVCLDVSLARLPQAQWEADMVPPERVTLRTSSRLVALDSIVLGNAIGVLPCGLAARCPDLVLVDDVIAELTAPLWLVTHADLARSERIRGLLDFLQDDLERERPLLEGASVHRRVRCRVSTGVSPVHRL